MSQVQSTQNKSEVQMHMNYSHVEVVFDAAKEIIISQNLERLGFGQL